MTILHATIWINSNTASAAFLNEFIIVRLPNAKRNRKIGNKIYVQNVADIHKMAIMTNILG